MCQAIVCSWKQVSLVREVSESVQLQHINIFFGQIWAWAYGITNPDSFKQIVCRNSGLVTGILTGYYWPDLLWGQSIGGSQLNKLSLEQFGFLLVEVQWVSLLRAGSQWNIELDTNLVGIEDEFENSSKIFANSGDGVECNLSQDKQKRIMLNKSNRCCYRQLSSN